MKAELHYREGIVYKDLPQSWYNRDRIYMPPNLYPSVVTQSTQTTSPTINEHTFDACGFKMIGKELVKIFKEK